MRIRNPWSDLADKLFQYYQQHRNIQHKPIRKNKINTNLMIKVTEVNGKMVSHLDVILTTCTTKLGLKDRIKALFGMPIKIETKIYTMNDYVDVKASTSTVTMDPVFKTKKEGPAMQGYVKFPGEKFSN